MFVNGNKLELMIINSANYHSSKNISYKQRLALILGQKQRQRPAVTYPQPK